jgi:hypothetical protein
VSKSWRGGYEPALSVISVAPSACAQWAQQKMRPSLSTPCADDPAAAMVAGRDKRMNRAFEAVEHVRLTAAADLERFVVVVPTDLAAHRQLLVIRRRRRVRQMEQVLDVSYALDLARLGDEVVDHS